MNHLYRLLLATIVCFLLFFQPADPAGTCGTTLHTITPFDAISYENKIVGGVDIGYYKYPWYVALMHHDKIFCGGTLISNRYVVSAAHCYDNYVEQASAGLIKLKNVLAPIFGVYNICDSKEVTHKRNRISKVFIHESYKKNGNIFDISLLMLKKRANGFEPVCMPTHVYTSDERPREGLITGLGSQMYHGNTTCALREARILIYPDEACQKNLDGTGGKGSELKDAFCAGYLQDGIGACQGDSGGPLMILGHDSKFTLLGVVSFGQDCNKPRHLGVYTDVSKYLDWIYNKMKKPIPTNTPTESSTTPTSLVTPTKPLSPQSTIGYQPSTYVFPTDFITPMSTTEWPRLPSYEYYRPIIIIINKKNMQGNEGNKT